MSNPTKDRPPRIHGADAELQEWFDEAYRLARHGKEPQAHRHGVPPEADVVRVEDVGAEDIRADDVYAALEEILDRPVERGAPLPPPDEIITDPVELPLRRDSTLAHRLAHALNLPH